MSILSEEIKKIVESMELPPPIFRIYRGWRNFDLLLIGKAKVTENSEIASIIEAYTQCTYDLQRKIVVRKHSLGYINRCITQDILLAMFSYITRSIPNIKNKKSKDPLFIWYKSQYDSYAMEANSQFSDDIYAIYKWIKSDRFTDENKKDIVKLLHAVAVKNKAKL